MNIKTGLFGLGLLTAAGALTISCGGSDGDSDNTGGSSATAGSSNGGATATAGSTNGTAGSTNGTAGSTNNGGNTNGTAGTTNNNGGTTSGGRDNNGGDGPIFGGGEGNVPGCPATQPAEDSECERNGQNRFGCPYGNVVCQCNGQQDNRTWECEEPQGFGGAGPDLPQADSCPDNAMSGDDCEGDGQCPGQACWCNDGNVFCFGGMP
jgi:hypothetical protein